LWTYTVPLHLLKYRLFKRVVTPGEGRKEWDGLDIEEQHHLHLLHFLEINKRNDANLAKH
jgi:hypothetical protein